MCLFSLAKIEQELEREVQSPQAEAAFLEFVARLPPGVADSLAGWPSVRAFLAAAGAKTEAADPVLKCFVAAFQQCGDRPWTAIALYIFWDQLAAVCRGLYWLDEPAALFSQANWSLLQALRQIDQAKRPVRLGQKIINDTWHDVRLSYQDDCDADPSTPQERKAQDAAALAIRQHLGYVPTRPPEIPRATKWNRRSSPDSDEPDPIEEIPNLNAEHAAVCAAIDRSWAISRLRALARAGRISRADFQILLGCYVYGRPLEKMARHLGVEYQAAKKRRQRAVKKLEKSSPDLSPSSPDSPLCPIGRSARREADDAR